MHPLFKFCVPLYKYGMKGDWAAAKRILENNEILKHAAITKGWSTLLHVAAGANHSHFVEELLDMLLDKHVLLQDSKGNTAFCFAASSGNMSIANLLLDRNEYLPKIRGGGGYLPIQFAVMQGKCEMTWFLYRKINREEFEEPDRKSLFFSSIKTGNHRFALQVAEHWPDLAWARDQNNDTALHILAFNQAPLHSCSHCPDIAHPIKINPGMEKQVTFQLVKYLWENILLNKKISEVIRIISEPYQAIFDAAEEVKKIMPPHLIIMKNSDGLTAQDLFTKEHEGLRKKGEEWMKRTAEFCMLISTVIATAVFSAAINIPGGIDDGTKKPNYLNQTSFLVFAISDGAAFISSSTAILIFLSILMSRYAEYDFYKSLPLKLISGLITLFISIACMMVAFASAFFITYNYGSRVIPDYIAVLVCPPLFLYIFLQFSLWSDIIYSTFYWRTLFRPTKRMIYT
ncbi:uncharacterized protein HKW66_Vig0089960 [Vigna angularis]|uniref:PGG domain-containing protein n=1 Tax=Phaseolus angularis TaxID=3914 RepID=A0A8T0KJJ5_PHAAN|nr:uncharacterized protein HKW66_Vig0089960 [Vigna angularis]